MSIILNVSGKIFRVSRDVICKSELFKNLLADCDTIDNEIMVDRSPKLFEHIYAYLIDDAYPYPKKYYSELKYYLIPYDIDLLYDPNKLLVNKDDLEKIKDELKEDLEAKFNKINDSIELLDPANDICPYPGCKARCTSWGHTCDDHRDTCCHSDPCGGSAAYNDAYCTEHTYQH
jgi:hypothetical protein